MTAISEKVRFVSQTGFNILENLIETPYKSLLIASDSVGWSLDEDAIALKQICDALGVKARIGHPHRRRNACIHYFSQFALETPEIHLKQDGSRYSISYYHGGPHDPDFADVFASLVNERKSLSKVHISNSTMETYLLEAGFDNSQIANIPIGLFIDRFTLQTIRSKSRARKKLGIDEDAFVVGSFQKDGVGWGEGLEPKLIKGPDIFVEVLGRVRDKVENLHVLLSGPSRGYVMAGLKKLGIPYTHIFLKDVRGVAGLYHALDAYLLTSRVEGGPKSILESMASGVPLVATNVGQGVDLMAHGSNGWVAKNEDVEYLAEGILRVREDRAFFECMKEKGRATAEAQDYMAQVPYWKKLFFDGFLDL